MTGLYGSECLWGEKKEKKKGKKKQDREKMSDIHSRLVNERLRLSKSCEVWFNYSCGSSCVASQTSRWNSISPKDLTQVTVTNYLMKMIGFLMWPWPTDPLQISAAPREAIKQSAHQAGAQRFGKVCNRCSLQGHQKSKWLCARDYYLLKKLPMYDVKVGCVSRLVPSCLSGSAWVSLSSTPAMYLFWLNLDLPWRTTAW